MLCRACVRSGSWAGFPEFPCREADSGRLVLPGKASPHLEIASVECGFRVGRSTLGDSARGSSGEGPLGTTSECRTGCGVLPEGQVDEQCVDDPHVSGLGGETAESEEPGAKDKSGPIMGRRPTTHVGSLLAKVLPYLIDRSTRIQYIASPPAVKRVRATHVVANAVASTRQASAVLGGFPHPRSVLSEWGSEELAVEEASQRSCCRPEPEREKQDA